MSGQHNAPQTVVIKNGDFELKTVNLIGEPMEPRPPALPVRSHTPCPFGTVRLRFSAGGQRGGLTAVR